MAIDPASAPFTDDDRDELTRRGMSVGDALDQLARLSRGSGRLVLDRPALPGDGIERFAPSAAEALRAGYARARRAGRVTCFVPASGAASRMFAPLMTWSGRPGPLPVAELVQEAAAGDAVARETDTFRRRLRAFAFSAPLERALAESGAILDELARDGPLRPLLDALLGEPGLAYARRPKALVAFHRDAQGVRTALDEHLVDAARLVADGQDRVRVHVTLSPEHDDECARWLDSATAFWARALGVRFALERTTQAPSSDTLAVDAMGRVLRDASGRLVLRPGGHGALLGNLARCGADLAFIRNVDNVAAEPWKGPLDEWMPLVVGALVELEEQRNRALADLDGGGDGEEAESFARDRLRQPPPDGPDGEARRERLRDWLDRPIRVCGMVPNAGDPGGGPFWVREASGGSTLQIVEGAQVDTDPGQRSILERSTYFNPVFMAVALRAPGGESYDLPRFVDPDAVIVTHKPHQGRELRALERPGLWNGGMARWLTLFVEVPIGVFTPVKTVLDLLRPEHGGP